MNSIMGADLWSDSENKYPKLHAMGFGELLDTTFSLYRTHFWTFLGVSAGYCPAMFLMISVFLLDDSLGRGPKVAIWIPNFVPTSRDWFDIPYCCRISAEFDWVY